MKYICPENAVSPAWGRMAGEEVSEKMLETVREYMTRYWYPVENTRYWKIINATVNYDRDEVEVKLWYCGCLERRWIKLNTLFSLYDNNYC